MAFLALLALVLASLPGEVLVYECDVLPPDAGWTLQQNYCDAEEFSVHGTLVHPMEMCPEQGGGQQLDYLHDIDTPSATPAFFAEWRLEATGPVEELPYVAPSAFVVWSGSTTMHHFTMARDRVRYIRDNLTVPTTFFDIVPGVAHTYRVEHFSDVEFTVFIDGVVVESGTPFGSLLAPAPLVAIRGKAKFEPSTTTWQYMRWGVIPQPASADFNSDGQTDDWDIAYVSECIERSSAGEPAYPSCAWADVTDDPVPNTVDCFDWELIKSRYWTGTGDPPLIEQCNPAIPAVSEWGMMVMAGLVLAAGAIVYRSDAGAKV